MKFIEITGSILLPISNEENIILEKIREHVEPMPKNKLDLREQEIARQLVNRGFLTRIKFSDKLCFIINDHDELFGVE